jgi:hypothetical protein
LAFKKDGLNGLLAFYENPFFGFWLLAFGVWSLAFNFLAF